VEGVLLGPDGETAGHKGNYMEVVQTTWPLKANVESATADALQMRPCLTGVGSIDAVHATL
jgi:hypothetical protein